MMLMVFSLLRSETARTYPAWEHLFVVDIALDPTHKMLDVFWSGHLGRLFEVFVILPEVFESRINEPNAP